MKNETWKAANSVRRETASKVSIACWLSTSRAEIGRAEKPAPNPQNGEGQARTSAGSCNVGRASIRGPMRTIAQYERSGFRLYRARCDRGRHGPQRTASRITQHGSAAATATSRHL